VTDCGSNDGDDFEFCQSGSRQPYPLSIAAGVRGCKEKTFCVEKTQIIFRQAFKRISVFELQTKP